MLIELGRLYLQEEFSVKSNQRRPESGVERMKVK